MHFLIQIGPVAPMTTAPLVAIVSSLALIFSHGALENNQLSHGPVQRPSIVLLQMPLSRLHGFSLYFVNLVFFCTLRLHFGETILEQHISLPTQSFMPVRSTSRLTCTLFGKKLLLVVSQFVFSLLKISWLIFLPNHGPTVCTSPRHSQRSLSFVVIAGGY